MWLSDASSTRVAVRVVVGYWRVGGLRFLSKGARRWPVVKQKQQLAMWISAALLVFALIIVGGLVFVMLR